MFKRPRTLLVIPVILVLAAAAGLAVRTGQAQSPTFAVMDVPDGAQASAQAALARIGYTPAAAPVWAAMRPGWQAPGRYRLFFSAASAGGGSDIYRAEAVVDAAGQAAAVRDPAHVTDTPAGAEDPPVLADGWLAFGTRVAGSYQTVTCLPLADLARPEVFALQRPAQGVQLAWSSAGRGPALSVTATWPGKAGAAQGSATMVLDPAAQRVTAGETELAYQPAVQGEQAWLPALVSRVRELPFVGPEKIAFLENVFFTAQDGIMRLLHAGSQPGMQPTPWVGPSPVAPGELTRRQAAASSTVEPSPRVAMAGLSSPVPATRKLSAGAAAGTTAEAPATAAAPAATVAPAAVSPLARASAGAPAGTPVASASAAASRAPTAQAAPPPSPTTAPSPTARPVPVLPQGAGQPLAEGVVGAGSFNPDPERPYAWAEAISIDPGLLQLKMMHGTWEPISTTGLSGGPGEVPPGDRPALVAAFNGGFAAMHGQFGMMVDRKIYLPARDGIATLAVYEDGSLRLGTWGQDFRQTPDMVSFRQNCPPLIENGTITAETGKLTLWGLSVSNAVYLYRSGLGVTADGRLVYVAGKPLSAYTLARAMQQAGAIYAMQLDVDEYHVAFITYEGQAGQEPVGSKLRDDMHGFDGLFLRPFQLDFFYLTRRPERLAAPLRQAAPAGAGAASAPAGVPALPGHLAFAANHGGQWQLYSMPAGQPDQLTQLTSGPGDNLYPAWSPDGRRLAFTSRRDGNAEIYVLDAPAPGQPPAPPQRVTQQPSEEWAPAWSPDGTKLAYQSDRSGQSDIYVSAVDGSGETRLTPWQGNNEAPHWSPDGQQIIFDSDLDVAEEVHASINVYVMAADGSQPRRVITAAESPSFSPDGTAVAFASGRRLYWGVFVQNLSGAGLRRLSADGANARYPAWSPDGRWVAFAADQGGRWDIYVAPAGGGQAVRLTNGAADSSYPAWAP